MQLLAVKPAEGETGATLATAAAREAIERTGLTPGDIDLIIYATQSPDFNFSRRRLRGGKSWTLGERAAGF